MKLCIDCVHHKTGHRCDNPLYAQVSPVDGRKMDSDCMIQRHAFSLPSCGQEGRGFEAKEKEGA